jgi:uncharacterized membrane protein YdjX (TVP38/TMEM64 family)
MKKLKPVLLVAALVAAVLLLRRLGLQDRIPELRDYIAGLGAWGYVVFIGAYAVFTVLAIPGSAMTVAAGAIFGSFKGVLVVSAASTLGAGLAFLAARYLARKRVSAWLAGNEKFRRLDELTAKHGEIIVAVTRLVPLFPFTLLNYGFGLTGIRFGTYLFWSWLCMLPGTVLYVVGADIFTKAVETGKVPLPLALLVGSVAVILALVARKAAAVIKEERKTK